MNNTPLKPFKYPIAGYLLLLIGLGHTYIFIEKLSLYKKVNVQLKDAVSALKNSRYSQAIALYDEVSSNAHLNTEHLIRFAFAHIANGVNLETGHSLLSLASREPDYERQYSNLIKEFEEIASIT